MDSITLERLCEKSEGHKWIGRVKAAIAVFGKDRRVFNDGVLTLEEFKNLHYTGGHSLSFCIGVGKDMYNIYQRILKNEYNAS
ncbi:hypothetical protein QJV44_gp27 [Serratia phage vB_SmaS_Tlacuache]|uniref:Uncharacterized protein n=1 Tax=Serratia phage vB_SmaS_Tlacuache TaxID=2894809 RepID=A0AAE8YVS0_9CAUD|nr:hypothetical protein QJV44_gp27 [Serratia phage vB_SmaS_Tlacuache]UGO51441.1 hypothetical protein TLACUACHE_27 [Serratia phage vB_SmaS_Tlacuache]